MALILREASGLTQDRAAEEANVDRSSVSRIEGGSRNTELLYRLIGVYGGVSFIDWLLEQLKTAREWYIHQQNFGSGLYA